MLLPFFFSFSLSILCIFSFFRNEGAKPEGNKSLNSRLISYRPFPDLSHCGPSAVIALATLKQTRSWQLPPLTSRQKGTGLLIVCLWYSSPNRLGHSPLRVTNNPVTAVRQESSYRPSGRATAGQPAWRA